MFATCFFFYSYRELFFSFLSERPTREIQDSPLFLKKTKTKHDHFQGNTGGKNKFVVL